MEKTEKRQEGNSFFKHFMVLGMGSLLYLVVGVIGTPIVTRLVDPVEYGQMSMFTVYGSIGMMLCGLGLDQTLVRYFYHHDEISYKRKLLFTCCAMPTAVGIVAGVLLICGRVLLNGFGVNVIPMSELLWLELYTVVLIVHRYALLVVRLNYHTKLYSTLNVVQKVLYIAITILLAVWWKKDYFLILILSTILSTLVAGILGMLNENAIWDFREIDKIPLAYSKKELLAYSLPLMLSSGVSMIFNALDKISINHFCTLGDVGVYASAMNLMAVFSIVRTSFNALWMPSAVAHYEKHPEDKSFYQRGNAFISVVMIIFGAGVILCKDLIVMLLGTKYQSAAQIIPFLMFEPIMYTISETTATGIVVQKQSKYQLMVVSGACLCNFIGNMVLTPIMGPRGAALSTGVSYIVFFALRTYFANKVFPVKYKTKGFCVAVAVLLGYAFYASEKTFSAVEIVVFAVIIFVVFVIYRTEILQAIQLAQQKVRVQKESASKK